MTEQGSENEKEHKEQEDKAKRERKEQEPLQEIEHTELEAKIEAKMQEEASNEEVKRNEEPRAGQESDELVKEMMAQKNMEEQALENKFQAQAEEDTRAQEPSKEKDQMKHKEVQDHEAQVKLKEDNQEDPGAIERKKDQSDKDIKNIMDGEQLLTGDDEVEIQHKEQPKGATNVEQSQHVNKNSEGTQQDGSQAGDHQLGMDNQQKSAAAEDNPPGMDEATTHKSENKPLAPPRKSESSQPLGKALESSNANEEQEKDQGIDIAPKGRLEQQIKAKDQDNTRPVDGEVIIDPAHASVDDSLPSDLMQAHAENLSGPGDLSSNSMEAMDPERKIQTDMWAIPQDLVDPEMKEELQDKGKGKKDKAKSEKETRKEKLRKEQLALEQHLKTSQDDMTGERDLELPVPR
jgi:hypothetical protein